MRLLRLLRPFIMRRAIGLGKTVFKKRVTRITSRAARIQSPFYRFYRMWNLSRILGKR